MKGGKKAKGKWDVRDHDSTVHCYICPAVVEVSSVIGYNVFKDQDRLYISLNSRSFKYNYRPEGVGQKKKARKKGRGEGEREGTRRGEEGRTKLPANPPAIKATPINRITLALHAAGPSDPYASPENAE